MYNRRMNDSQQFPLLVRDLMTVGVATCSPDTPAAEVAKLMVERNLETLVVLDPRDGHALGVISQDDLVGTYAQSVSGELRAEDIMRDGVPQIPADIPLKAAAQIMADQGVRALFLMHHSNGIEYPAAVITYTHILRFISASNSSELKDLGIKAERQSPIDAFIKRRDAAREKNLGNQR
jgi:CBS domain-containing protein